MKLTKISAFAWTAILVALAWAVASGGNMILICWYPKYRQEKNN